MQVETIHSALKGMQSKLSQVQKDIGVQLQRFQYLVDETPGRSLLSTPVHDAHDSSTAKPDSKDSQAQGTEPLEGHSKTEPRTDDAQGRFGTSGTTCPATSDNMLTTYCQKQGHVTEALQASTEALGYM
jgi:hypothetical protein